MRPAARAGAILIVVLLAISLSLLVFELVLRMIGGVPRIPQMFVQDERLGYRLQPSVRERAQRPGIYDYRWTVNSQGFRGRADHAIPKPADTRRVLMLGDSFTFGLGVDDDESFPARIQQRLPTYCPDVRTDVVNAGVGGYGTSHSVALLEDLGSELEPDVIVYGFYVNDPMDDQTHGLHVLHGDTLQRHAPPPSDASRAKALVDRIPGYNWLLRHSALVGWLRHQYFAFRARRGARDTAAMATPQSAPYDLALTEGLFGRMATLAAGMDAPLLVALIPDSSAMRRTMSGGESSVESTILDEVARRCAAAGIECIDLRPGLAATTSGGSAEELFIANEGHFSSPGYERTATLLTPHIAETLECRGGTGGVPGDSSRADSPLTSQRTAR